MQNTNGASLRHRRALVETLRRDDHLHSPRVEAALLAVPREIFVPGVPLEEVYRPSEAIVTKRVDGMSVSSASAPEVIALMLEQLDPQPGERVLEIGAGTGYNAALLAHMVGETGHVLSVDIDEDLVLGAREHLGLAGYDRVKVVQADGALGYPESGPYDRIILTVASGDIAPAWRDQLALPHGRLVLPLALRGLQRCAVFIPDPEDPTCLVSRSLRTCSFISLRGLLGAGPPRVSLDRDGEWVLGADETAPPLAPETVAELLTRPMHVWPTAVTTSLDELRQGLQLWLVTHQANIYTLWAASRLPDLFSLGERVGARGTLCLIQAAPPRLALLAWSDESAPGGEVSVLTHRGGDELAQRLQRLLTRWVAEGRPQDTQAVIRAYPRGAAPAAGSPEEVVIDERWTSFILSWT